MLTLFAVTYNQQGMKNMKFLFRSLPLYQMVLFRKYWSACLTLYRLQLFHNLFFLSLKVDCSHEIGVALILYTVLFSSSWGVLSAISPETWPYYSAWWGIFWCFLVINFALTTFFNTCLCFDPGLDLIQGLRFYFILINTYLKTYSV